MNKKQYTAPAVRVQLGELETAILEGGSTLGINPNQNTGYNLSKEDNADWEE